MLGSDKYNSHENLCSTWTTVWAPHLTGQLSDKDVILLQSFTVGFTEGKASIQECVKLAVGQALP